MTDILPIAGRPLLQVKNLTFEFPLRTGVFRAVSDLSFSIDPPDMRPGASKICRIDRAVTDLPDPLSPTTQSVLHGSIE
ncbi:hypothetical protein ACC674_38310, partial [Rhizobium ruizarguesonis]